jgi:hypothetical protein
MSQKKSYPALDIVATAVAAYAHNESKVVRNTDQTDGKVLLPNRQLISDYFAGTQLFVVNDFHRKEAEGIVQYLQQTVIMQSLKGDPDRFLAQVTELLSNNEISMKSVGIVAWAPKLADDYQKKDHVRELSARYEYRSQYVGRVGDKTEMSFTLIDKRYIKSMDCWAVYGIDAQDNLIFYWARNLDKVCEVGRIYGRIKEHKQDSYRGNARVTVLNYVKVL